MKILTCPNHTTCDNEWAMVTREEFFSLDHEWDEKTRPQPSNWRFAEAGREEKCDFIFSATKPGFEKLERFRLPLIFCEIVNLGKGQFYSEIEDRSEFVVFAAPETAARKSLRDESKKRIIEHTVDTDLYSGYAGDGLPVLSVGNKVAARPELGPNTLQDVDQFLPVDLVGFGNEDMRSGIGVAENQADLAERYRRYKVYFNPSCIVGCSVLEALSTGMPVVSMSPVTFTDLIEDGENGFIVKTPEEAVVRIKELLENEGLRHRMGEAARRSVVKRFHRSVAAPKWKELFDIMMLRAGKKVETP